MSASTPGEAPGLIRTNIDHAIMSCLSELTIYHVFLMLRSQNPVLDVSLGDIEARVAAFLHDPAPILSFVSADLCQVSVFTADENFMVLLLSRFATSDDDDAADLVREFRYCFNLSLPSHLVGSQVSLRRGLPPGDVSRLVAKSAVGYARLEKASLECSFSPGELDHAAVSDAAFAFWRRSFEKLPTDQNGSKKVPVAPLPAALDAAAAQFRFLTQSLVGVALLLGFDCTYVVQKKVCLVGSADDCDLNLQLADDPAMFLVMLKSDLRFYLENLGPETIWINGTPVGAGRVSYLPAECVVKTRDLVAVFLPNVFVLQRLWNRMRRGQTR
jgi:hypothetical protein